MSSIDSKTASNGLDMVGCRIELDGYDCQPNNGTDLKYTSGQTGASWGNQTSPAHVSCSDGGNIELYADHQISPVKVGASTYVYVAVGAGTNPEMDIVNVSSVPTNASNPKINANACGTIGSGNSSWKRNPNPLDFDPANGTEEAANSVYAKSDGTRAYMSSNGGIIHNGIPDSDQFYILDTTDKNNPKFLTSWSTTSLSPNPKPWHYANTASTGYYNGDATNIELYPRRALTVLNGQRAILVGQDGLPNDGIEPQEYQVLNLDSESTPTYCGGVNDAFGFNDLTSVTEANGDNYVYMVENSNQKQLKIIQGGPDNNIYADSGTFTSSALSSTAAFNHFAATISQPASATIKMQIAAADVGSDGTCSTANFSFLGPDGTSSTFFTPTGSTISGTIPFISTGTYKNPGKCLKYQTTLLTSPDKTQTPTLYDTTVNYSP